MSKVFIAKIRVPGTYRDVWLYKRRLYMWDRAGTLRFADLEVVAKYLTKAYGIAVSNIMQTLIFRNDWKVGDQFRSMMRVPEVETAYLRPFHESNTLVVNLPEWLFKESDSEPYSGLVLDTQVYADRVYLATPEGLLESYINAKHPARGYSLNQQTDFRIARISVRYAAINASAEDRGLYFGRVKFADEGDPGFRRSSWMKVADASLSTSHIHHNLLNYTGDVAPSLLTARVEEKKTRETARFEESQVVGYEGETDLSSLIYSATSGAARVSINNHSERQFTGEFEVLGNTNNHLLAIWNGKARVIDIRAEDGSEIEAKPSATYRTNSLADLHPDEILQTYPVSRGFVVELYDSIRLITLNGSFQLSDGQAARVRTFSSSLRHKEAIAIVHEEDVALMGFYIVDETLF